MASVGEQLRQAREKQNLSISQVVERTKLRTDHVLALEESHYDVFAAAVYIRGFVRSYAALVRLDVPRIMKDLEAELAQLPKFQESTSLSKPSPGFVDFLMLQLSKVNWAITLIVAGSALVLYLSIQGYRAWRVHKATDPLADLGPGLYQSAQTNTGETLPLTPPPPRP